MLLSRGWNKGRARRTTEPGARGEISKIDFSLIEKPLSESQLSIIKSLPHLLASRILSSATKFVNCIYLQLSFNKQQMLYLAINFLMFEL